MRKTKIKRFKRVVNYNWDIKREYTKKEILTVLIIGMTPIINIIVFITILFDYEVYYEEIK